MAGGFNMMALMNNATKGEAKKPKYEAAELPIEKIIPNPGNLYSMEGIDELADSILLAGRVLQNIVVKAADQDGQYMIISGHRRIAACKKLVGDGHTEFGTVPALIENEADENLRELMLIYTNATARILTDAEKMRQAQRATEILKNLKAEGKFEGRIRDAVARMLDTTGAQLARYAAIANNLTNPELKEAFDDGRLGVSAAYEASGLSDKGQGAIADKLAKGGVSIQDVKEAKEQEKPADFAQAKVLTNSEGIPMRETKLNLHKKFKKLGVEIIIYTIENAGKYYADSEVNYKLRGWGGYPKTTYDTAYNTEQEAIEAEIRDIAAHDKETHRVLWESGYCIVGDPNANQQEETAQPPAKESKVAAVAKETKLETEPPAEETEKEPRVSPEVYALTTILNELTALEESYRGAAERHVAMGGNHAGRVNLETTASFLRRLIDQSNRELEEVKRAQR